MSDANGTFSYGPGGATEKDLRLLGDVSGKRLLELGCGTGAVSIALAHPTRRRDEVDMQAGGLSFGVLLLNCADLTAHSFINLRCCILY